MKSFSERNKYSKSTVIIEDAPDWLRVLFVNKVYSYFVNGRSIDIDLIDSRLMDDYDLPEYGILKPNELFHLIRTRLRIDFSGDPIEIIYHCKWHEFYSIIEIIADNIYYVNQKTNLSIQPDPEGGSIKVDDFLLHDIMVFNLDYFSSAIYQKLVNDLFAKYQVGWRLDDERKITRTTPEILEKSLTNISEEIKDQFEPAFEHLNKAIKYCHNIPLDTENSVKEIVSALESLGRTMVPGSKTLTDVVKELRKMDKIPTKILELMQVFYNYASDEPGVRHGKPQKADVKIEDAEFCLHLGAALIHYLYRNNNYHI